MSPDTPSDDTVGSPLDEGVLLALKAKESGDWTPVAEWLARHPADAVGVLEFLDMDGKIPGHIPPAPPERSGSAVDEFELGDIAIAEGIGCGDLGDLDLRDHSA